ncbi:hypothetical protein ABEB36_000010 [Hypothenemus hampei]|uniref:MADF domain-containing protein n=1 Tax=Hypothenemus hampei TaxID=57062 RepID=A0ABD1FD49_HYPHA
MLIDQKQFANFNNASLAFLISIIQNYEYLYDLSQKDYKNKLLKNRAWQEISEMTNMSVDECQRQWRNLRDRFTKEKRQLPSGSGMSEVNWEYFENMQFYNKYTRPRKTHTPIQNNIKTQEVRPSSACSSSSLTSWSSMNIILSPPAHSDTQEQRIEREDTDIESNQLDLLVETPKSLPNSTKLRTKRKAADEELQKVVEMAKKIAVSMERKPEESPNKTFSDYVRSRLNEMSPEKAKEKRKQIFLQLECE